MVATDKLVMNFHPVAAQKTFMYQITQRAYKTGGLVVFCCQ